MDVQPSDGVDWFARITAGIGLLISVWTLWRGKTRVRLYLGQQDREDTIVVSNLSPHAIEVVALGAVKPNGYLKEFFDGHDPWLAEPKRIEARGQRTFKLSAEVAPFNITRLRSVRRAGCFVRLAGGEHFSNPGRVIRHLWWLLSGMERIFRRSPKADRL